MHPCKFFYYSISQTHHKIHTDNIYYRQLLPLHSCVSSDNITYYNKIN